MTNPVDPVLGHHTSQERQPAAVPGLPNVLNFEVTIMIIVLLFALYCVIVNCGITHVVVIFYIVITMNEVR